MRYFQLTLAAAALLLFSCAGMSNPTVANDEAMSNTPDKSIHDFTMTTLEGDQQSLSEYKGKVLIIVNTASKCGYTPQYEDMQAYYEANKDRDVVILGFPANNFGGQEPGSDSEIAEFCEKNYGVNFPMFSKISVKGDDTHPLYQYLTNKDQNGRIDAKVGWNFNKFVVDQNGHVVAHFGSSDKVSEQKISELVDELLKG